MFLPCKPSPLEPWLCQCHHQHKAGFWWTLWTWAQRPLMAKPGWTAWWCTMTASHQHTRRSLCWSSQSWFRRVFALPRPDCQVLSWPAQLQSQRTLTHHPLEGWFRRHFWSASLCATVCQCSSLCQLSELELSCPSCTSIWPFHSQVSVQ